MKDLIILFDIDYTLFDTAEFKTSNLTSYNLYPQVKNILNMLSNKFTLGILSQGEHAFQIKKLQETGIYELFDKSHTFITLDKHGELEYILSKIKSEHAVFIEDKLEMLKKAKELDPNMITIWIKNGPFAASTKEEFIPDFSVSDFEQVLPLLEKIFEDTLS